jgi:hypothetical protein
MEGARIDRRFSSVCDQQGFVAAPDDCTVELGQRRTDEALSGCGKQHLQVAV